MIKFMRHVVMIALTTVSYTTQASLPSAEFDAGLTGRVSMEGSIYSTPCDINTGDDYQAIEMPVESRTHIKRTGVGESQFFSIYLTHCALDVSESSVPQQYLQIIFDGDEDVGLFRVKGNANGVALELMDKNGDVIRPGKTMPYQLLDDENRFDYKLRLKTNMRNLMVGDYNAIIRYRVEYF